MNDMSNRPTTPQHAVPVPADIRSASKPASRPPADTTETASVAPTTAPPVNAANNTPPPVPQLGAAVVQQVAQTTKPEAVTPERRPPSTLATSEELPAEPIIVPSAIAPDHALRIRVGMTTEERRRYAEDTKRRGSRARPSPTIAKYEGDLRELIALKAVIKVVFQDLIESDPEALEEFGKGGYRAFNARLSRELK